MGAANRHDDRAFDERARVCVCVCVCVFVCTCMHIRLHAGRHVCQKDRYSRLLTAAMASSHAIKLLALSLVLVSSSACVCSDAGSAPARGCEAGCPRRRLFSESEAGKRGETGAQPGLLILRPLNTALRMLLSPLHKKVRINLMFGAIQKN